MPGKVGPAAWKWKRGLVRGRQKSEIRSTKARLRRKHEIRSKKSETNAKHQEERFKTGMPTAHPCLRFELFFFGFGACFGFRASDCGFLISDFGFLISDFSLRTRAGRGSRQ